MSLPTAISNSMSALITITIIIDIILKKHGANMANNCHCNVTEHLCGTLHGFYSENFYSALTYMLLNVVMNE